MAIKREDSNRFYQKMSSLAREKKFPLKAMFELTYKCNFRCIHCYICPNKKKKELTARQVKQILDQLKAAGCFHVGFTGGEPLLRKDIFGILGYAKANGFRITLLTNGFLIDKKVARKIASLGTSLNRVDVSVLGASEKTFESITRKRGSFKKVLRAIKLLKDEGVDVQIKATLMKPNQDEFLDIKKLAEKFDTMFRYTPSVNSKVNGDKSPLAFQVEPEEVYQIKRKLAGQEKAINEGDLEGWNPKDLGRKVVFRCGVGQREVTISPYGQMNLCLEIHYPEYDILRGSFQKGWEKIKKFVAGFEPGKDYLCGNCVLAPFCRWCPARSWVSAKDFTGCSESDRKLALVEAQHSSPAYPAGR